MGANNSLWFPLHLNLHRVAIAIQEIKLAALAAEADRRGLMLRLQVSRPLGLGWTLRVGVARAIQSEGRPGGLALLGELKGWALPAPAGLRLDTMRVQGNDTAA
ncbi:MAG: hypothetical protein WD136_07415, partial [Cyanobium sp.]